MITAPQDTWGLDFPYAIHPTTGQEDPRREPQAEPDQDTALTDTGGLPQDRVTLSGQHADPDRHPTPATPSHSPQAASGEAIAQGPDRSDDKANEEAQSQAAAFGEEATDSQEAEEVRELKRRDAEVKAHEQAHMAAGGGLIQGAANFTYEKGPDGVMYAVGGEVKIDTSPARTPDQTIRKAQQIRRAALAPAQPSATDRAVAAAASQMEAQARAEKAQEAASGDEAASPEAASPGAGSSQATTRTEIGPGSESEAQDMPPGPFAAPAVQAYRATAAAGTFPPAISTFV